MSVERERDTTGQFIESDLCKWGHKFTEENTAFYSGGDGNRYRSCRECDRVESIRSRRKLKEEVFSHYGDSCACCGETEEKFLALDHVDGNGNAHRKELGIGAGNQFYQWLKRQEWPKGFQTLCMNCNHAKGHYGACPHNG